MLIEGGIVFPTDVYYMTHIVEHIFISVLYYKICIEGNKLII